MISLELARKLKQAGLTWEGNVNDFFAIPDRGLDKHLFVLSDMMANLDIFRGWPVVTFHGAAEWALDYILTSEVVWMPTETQLREAVEDILLGEVQVVLGLTRQPFGYRCTLEFRGETFNFEAANASDAYGQALLYLLEARGAPV